MNRYGLVSNRRCRMRSTCMLWILWFAVVFSYYGMFLWLPSVMVGKGFDLISSFKYVLIMTLAQLPGYFTAAWFCHKWGKIAKVESNNEYWMMLEAKLREDFNIPGDKIQDTMNLQKKSEMKKLFRSVGAPVADGVIVADRKTLDDFIKKHGYPVFAKPDRGVGAAGGFKISNEDDVANFWLKKPDCDYFVEEFVEGDLTTFDGLVNKDGEIEFTSSLCAFNSAFDLVANNDDLSFYINRNIPADQEEIGRKCVKAFALKAS